MSKEKGRLVTPNDMLAAAKEHMLEGREPSTKKDWMLVMNFMAFNIGADAEEPACQLLARIYDMPLTEDEITKIVQYQVEKKRNA